MLRSGILNPAINSLLSRVRHTNTLVIADRGFPYWPHIETVDISLVDDIPPYEWSGQGACARWFDAFDASVKLNEITEPSVMLGKTKHLEVTGDRAYVVAPARHVFKERGALVNQAGIVTVALQKDASGWRMTAWIWSEQ